MPVSTDERGSGLTFRPARESDFPEVAALVRTPQELFRVYPRGSYPLTVEQLQGLSRLRRDLTVALLDGAVVGFANLYDLVEGDSAFIGNVIVADAQRGKGIGRALVSHMATLAFAQYPLSQVRISVFNDNTPALLLYGGLGFRPYAIEARVDPCGTRVALLHMSLAREAWGG